MLNGHRDTFRLNQRRAPSPDHTSDSEETWVMKGKYWAYLRAIFEKWRGLQRQAAWLRAWRSNFERWALQRGVYGMPAFEQRLVEFMRS